MPKYSVVDVEDDKIVYESGNFDTVKKARQYAKRGRKQGHNSKVILRGSMFLQTLCLYFALFIIVILFVIFNI